MDQDSDGNIWKGEIVTWIQKNTKTLCTSVFDRINDVLGGKTFQATTVISKEDTDEIYSELGELDLPTDSVSQEESLTADELKIKEKERNKRLTKEKISKERCSESLPSGLRDPMLYNLVYDFFDHDSNGIIDKLDVYPTFTVFDTNRDNILNEEELNSATKDTLVKWCKASIQIN